MTIMTEQTPESTAPALVCIKCQLLLATRKVEATYLGSSFPVELLRCPSCGYTYVPEALAAGKMQQVEQALEDK
jgi:hypothetical protein